MQKYMEVRLIMKKIKHILFIFVLSISLLSLFSDCASKKGTKEIIIDTPSSPIVISTEKGIASYYGEDFHGRTTANGEIYDMYKLTAAHKTLPFGTYVRVTNLSNNRQVVVRINDRGPFVKDRIIDLSVSAAEELMMIVPGTAEVLVEVLK
jgi:rare lipoprotein A (peptidoglycan hydrolase)